MKLNWGHFITISLSLFMLFIVYLVFQASKQRVDLVADDYYQQEIDFQTRIEANELGKEFMEEFRFGRFANSIEIKYPESFKGNKISGEFHFYRPDNSSLDRNIVMQPNDQNVQFIDRSNFKTGFYEINVSWTLNKKEYYFKKKINIGE